MSEAYNSTSNVNRQSTHHFEQIQEANDDSGNGTNNSQQNSILITPIKMQD